MATTFSLRAKLPPEFFEGDDAETLETLLDEILQPVLDLYYDEQNRAEEQHDVDTAESDTVNAWLIDAGVLFPAINEMPLRRRRLLVRAVFEIFSSMGTADCLIRTIRLITGLEVIAIINPAVVTTWLLGVHVLADRYDNLPPYDPVSTNLAILGGFSTTKYTFQIQFGIDLTVEQKRIVREIVFLVKPVYMHFLGILGSSGTTPPDTWELGPDELGPDTILS